MSNVPDGNAVRSQDAPGQEFDSDDEAGTESNADKEKTALPRLTIELPGGKNINIRRSSLKAQSNQHAVRPPGDVVMTAPRKRVSTIFGSWDYHAIESQAFIKEDMHMDPKTVKRLSMMRWLVNFGIGVYVAIIGVLVWVTIKYLSLGKFTAVYMAMEHCETFGCTLGAMMVWIVLNVFFVFVGAYMVTFHAPSAAGSGIPQVKCYLNGIRMPGLMSLRTLLAKAGGVSLSVVGGLACGKEGPMIHTGAICASGLASGHFKLGKLKCSPSCCDGLRTDEERRDFVAAGAASGVSAAFASPIGGVLFALEEGASFVKQELTWRMLFSSFIAGLTLNILMSALKGHPTDLSNPGLISFGYLGDISFMTFELPIFLVMGIFGGLLGALFVQINYHNTIFRRKKVVKPWYKVGEACLIAACSAILFHALIFAIPDCGPLPQHQESQDVKHVMLLDPEHPPQDTIMAAGYAITTKTADGHNIHRRSATPHNAASDHSDSNITDYSGMYGNHGHGFILRGLCPMGEHNRMANILFTTPEGGLHQMLHGGLHDWDIGTIIILFILYHLLTTWTYGISVSSGLFIPSLLIGAMWGRVVGMLVMAYIPAAGTNVSKYALVGAAAQLGGFTRMTLSLTIIVIECTGDITFSLPIIITLIMAKWMGDFFNPGIYDLHIEIWGAPILAWEPPSKTYGVPAHEVMSSPVETLRITETLSRIKAIVDNKDSHNGFPVVDDFDPTDTQAETFGRLKGFIKKKDLVRLLEERMREMGDNEEASLNEKICLKDHMEKSPYSVQDDVSLTRVYNIFRRLGLRHLVVVNDRNRVVGIITRLNVARFRGEMVKGKFHVDELDITHK